MQPIKIRVSRIIDFGTIVTIVGDDVDTKKPITVHVDHRPFQSFWEAWQRSGQQQPIEFDAERLTLNLDLAPDDDACAEHDDPVDVPPAA